MARGSQPLGEREDSPRHWCFGCGDRNPEGLHIDFEVDGPSVTGRFTPRKSHQGFPGVAHGGLAAAAMDEAMGWAMYASGAWAMTARMEVKYRKPLALGEELIVTAEATRDRGRWIEATSEIRTTSGATPFTGGACGSGLSPRSNGHGRALPAAVTMSSWPSARAPVLGFMRAVVAGARGAGLRRPAHGLVHRGGSEAAETPGQSLVALAQREAPGNASRAIDFEVDHQVAAAEAPLGVGGIFSATPSGWLPRHSGTP